MANLPGSILSGSDARARIYQNMQDLARAGIYQSVQDLSHAQAMASMRSGFVPQTSTPSWALNMLSTPPEGDSIELFHIAATPETGDCDVVPVYLPLGDAGRVFSFDTIKIMLPLYRTREDAEAAMQKMVRKSLYAKVVGGIEAIVDMAFRRGVSGEPEKALHNALLDYKTEIDK